MKLDSRIIEGKKPLDCFDSEYAKQFIGKKGFFADELDQFCDLSKMNEAEATLKNVWHDETLCFFPSAIAMRFKYFLPSEWVTPEKKWRPYTSIEFAEKFEWWVGNIIRIRDRPENAEQKYEYKMIFTGYRWYKDVIEVFINGHWIDLLTLFDLYEYREDGEWHKFGVEVKE